MGRHLTIFTDIHWTLIGFLIFLVLFLVLVGVTFLTSQKELYKKVERFPFEDDKGVDHVARN